MQVFHPGQRWISSTELHMGLGTVMAVEHRTVTILFLATGETRQHLDAAVNDRRLGALTLVASNPFLGELKAHLSDRVAKIVVASMAHDLSGLDLNELWRRLVEPEAAAD